MWGGNPMYDGIASRDAGSAMDKQPLRFFAMRICVTWAEAPLCVKGRSTLGHCGRRFGHAARAGSSCRYA